MGWTVQGTFHVRVIEQVNQEFCMITQEHTRTIHMIRGFITKIQTFKVSIFQGLVDY